MRRWFRRKGKDKDREEELEAASVEETALESETSSDLPGAEAEVMGEPEPKAPEVSPFEP
jgi:hypothetical protein